jgi:hypothetical protein
MSSLNVTNVQVTNIKSANGTNAITIDSTGRVNYPNRPLLSTSDTRVINLTDVVLTSANFYDQIDYNVGNCFNASTGRFTAPVAGYYFVSWISQDSSGNSTNVRLRKNGLANSGPVNEAYNQGINGANVSVTFVAQLAANDYIDVQVARLLTLGGIQHKRFIIYLLG